MSLLSTIKKESLPDSWDLKNIGAILNNSQYGTNEASVDNGNMQIVGMKDIQDGKILTNNLTKANLTKADREKFALNKGDILINRTNSYDLVGKVGLYNSDKVVGFASYLVRLSVNRKKADSVYINLWLNSYVAQGVIKRIATRAVSQANINPTEFKKLCPVPLPTLPEQKAIADLLSTWDEAIEKTEQLIQAKEKRFYALLSKLISDNGQLTTGKNDWKKVKLEAVCNVITSNVNKKTFNNEILVRLCNYMDVYKNFYITSELDFMEASATTSEIKKFQLKKNDVLLTKDSETSDDIANSACVVEDMDNVLCGYHLSILRPKACVKGPYLNYALHTPRIRYEFSRQANGVTRFGLTMQAYNKIEIPLPSLEKQKQIAETLSTAQQEINLLKQLSEKHKTQKRGLMQKLLTGDWRLKPEILNKYKEA